MQLQLLRRSAALLDSVDSPLPLSSDAPSSQVRCIDLNEPQGWVVVGLTPDEQPE